MIICTFFFSFPTFVLSIILIALSTPVVLCVANLTMENAPLIKIKIFLLIF